MRINLDETDLPEQVDLAIEGLARGEIFQREGRLVDVVRTAAEDAEDIVRPIGSPRIRLTPKSRVRELLMLTCMFTRRVDGTTRVVDPPGEIVNALLARGEWEHVRILNGIVECPVLRADGSVLTAIGYDRASAVIHTGKVEVEVPEHPRAAEALAALDEIEELLVDFPFGAPEHKSAYVAGLLTLFGRPAIDGPVPQILLDANVMGSGKTLLGDLYGAIYTGKPLPRRTAPDNPEEWRKAITSIAIAADPVVLIDNVTKQLRSDALDAVLTGTSFRDRLLGKNEEICLDVRTLFVATANNLVVSPDLVRRTLYVRLESQVERPEQRTGFRFPDLFGFVKENRARLIRAALTILRAYFEVGRPDVSAKLRPMGSYESWTRIIRAPLVWLGRPDPAITQDALRDEAEPESEELAALLSAWHEHYQGRAVTVAALLNDAKNDTGPLALSPLARVRQALGVVCDAPPGELPGTRRLGNYLRSVRGRIANGLVVTGTKGRDGAEWVVRSMQKPR